MANPVPAATENPAADTPKKKWSRKKLLAGLAAIAALGGSAAWYFTQGQGADLPGKTASTAALQPKYVPVDTFTVNLQKEFTDQYLQLTFSFKIYNPDLEQKIKDTMPEIRSRILMLLSTKYASELSQPEGKKELAREIILLTDNILKVPVAAPAPAGTQPPAEAEDTAGIADVLFTSFLIQ
jgi:flagellar FliL protein